jgi:glycosyltransferase involved in cell wall biosynthesis
VRILILSPYPILPSIHGGRVRTAGLAEGLARAGANVVLLCPWYPGQPRNGRVADAFTCRSHFLPSNLLPLTLEWLASPLALLSLQPLPRRVRRSFEDYDVVQFEFCAHARWMTAVPASARIVYSAHNVERDYCENDAARHLLWRSSMKRVEQLERLAVERSDLVLTCTEEDAGRLRQLYGEPKRSAVVPNGCQSSLLHFDRGPLRAESRAALGLGPDDRAILFLGGDASHNREAVRFLLTQVLPQLEPNARLLIVGKGGGPPARSADRRARFFGFVEDLRPYFAAADIAVNPVEQGSGSSVKLLEYLAAGLPVVSTAIGIRGLREAPAGVRIVPREEFARALCGPFADSRPDRTVLGRFTWEQLGRTLLREYERLAGSGSACSS